MEQEEEEDDKEDDKEDEEGEEERRRRRTRQEEEATDIKSNTWQVGNNGDPPISQNGSPYLGRLTWGRRELSWHHFTREVVEQLRSQIGPFVWNF